MGTSKDIGIIVPSGEDLTKSGPPHVTKFDGTIAVRSGWALQQPFSLLVLSNSGPVPANGDTTAESLRDGA